MCVQQSLFSPTTVGTPCLALNANLILSNPLISLSQNQQMTSNQIKNSIVTKESPKLDALAIGTQWTRQFFSQLHQLAGNVQETTFYKILTKTTQPAHVIAISIAFLVLCIIWPSSTSSKSDLTGDHQENSNNLFVLGYLGCFATHFGAQIWMTFISGLALYFSLPRHTFGICQQILFPKYFALNSGLSILTLIFYIKLIDESHKWQWQTVLQITILTICATIELIVRLYLAPPLLSLMQIKHKYEISAGSGQEIGHENQGDQLRKSEDYQKIHKSFRRIHMTIAIGNIVTLVCTFSHLIYLANKIRIF